MPILLSDLSYTTANSGSSNVALLTTTLPSSNAGDGLILIAYSNYSGSGIRIRSNSSFFTSIGFTSTFNSGSASNGHIGIWEAVSNGNMTTATVEADGAGTGEFSTIAIRTKGSHRLSLVASSYMNTASNGVSISTQSGTVSPVHDGGLQLTVLGVNKTASYVSGDEPTGYSYIAASNTSNTWFAVAAIEKPVANGLGFLSWNKSSNVGERRMRTFYVSPDVSWAGIKTTSSGSTVTINTTVKQRLQSWSGFTYLAKTNQEVYEFGIRVGSSVGDGKGVELGLYNVTNGFANAALIANGTIGTLLASQYNTVIIPPVTLIANNKYAVGYRSNSVTAITAYSAYQDNGAGQGILRESSKLGDSALSSSWDFDNGAPDTSRQTVWASVRDITLRLDDVNTTENVFTGQKSVIASGSLLSGQTIQIISGTRTINTSTVSSTNTTLTFDVPTDDQIFLANVGFGAVTFNIASNTAVGIAGTLNPNSSYFIHTVANTSQNANSGCLYYNITPAISSNDKFYLPANTYFGSNLTIDTQGFPTINSSTDVTDFFKYRIYDISDSTWGSEGTFVSIGSYNLASNTTVPTVVPAPDNRRYFRNPDGSSSKKITNNSEIILFGTFPAKANAAPVYFDNYNGRANGTLATSIGLKNLQGDGTTPQVSNTRSFTGTKSLRVDYSTASGSFFPRIGIDGLSANQVYISAHIYWERYVTGAANSFIFKLCRAGSNDSYTGAPRFYETVFANHTTGAITTTDRGYVQSNSNAVLVTTLNKGPNRDSWSRTEYYYRLSTPGVSDGVFQTSVDNVRNANVTNALTRIAGDSNTINWVISPFDGLDTKGIDNAYYLYVDNLYIDTTQVRVEVGDAPTLAACTNKLCAIPSFWSTSKIVATVDTSIWPVGTALYAFVIDENGNQVASSYAMTVS